jgi:hypothetical protein
MSDLKAKEYKSFEAIKRVSETGEEFWYARDLAPALEYVEWRNFAKVLDRARLACRNSGYAVADHFVEVNKTIKMPKTASKQIIDFKLSRYACYLIVQNADAANEVHFIVGKEVRGTIERVGGTMPEDLPVPSKSISAIEREQLRKLKKSPKKLLLDE